MFEVIDKISDFCGRASAWIFFTIGGIIVFEVVARYVFMSPTVWGEEMSRFLQIWATYLAAAYVLHNRQLIAIDLLVQRMPRGLQVASEATALIIIAVFSLVAFIYGLETVIESIKIGRATSTMLAVPKWMTEAAIPVGFGLMLLQTAVELIRTLSGKVAPASSSH